MDERQVVLGIMLLTLAIVFIGGIHLAAKGQREERLRQQSKGSHD